MRKWLDAKSKIPAGNVLFYCQAEVKETLGIDHRELLFTTSGHSNRVTASGIEAHEHAIHLAP